MSFGNNSYPYSTISFSPNTKFFDNSAYRAFANINSIYRVYNLPEGITNGAEMFYGCNNLNHNIKLPSTLQNVANLFHGCSNLNQKNLTLQFENVTNAAWMLSSCPNLYLNKPVILNGENVSNTFYAFYEVGGLADVILGNNVIGDETFWHINYINGNIIIGNNLLISSHYDLIYSINHFNGNILIQDNLYVSNYSNLIGPYINTNGSDNRSYRGEINIGNNAFIGGLIADSGSYFNGNITIGDNAYINCLVRTYSYLNFNGNITIGENVYINCLVDSSNNLNGKIIIKNNANYIGPIFSDYAYNFNSPNVFLGNNIFKMQGLFRKCFNYNQNIQFPKNIIWADDIFRDCHNFNQNVLFPNTLTNSFDNIFMNCYNLNQNIYIPNNIEFLRNTFYGCNNLNQNIQIPYGVKCIDYMFYGCENLNQNIYIPDSVESMQFTFAYCNKLLLHQNITIPQSVTHIDGISLGVDREIFNPITLLHNNIVGINFLFAYGDNDFNYSTVNIPPKVNHLQGLFYKSYYFNQNYHIPNRILDTSYMFYECRRLNQSINIPENIQNTAYMFYNCTNLNQSIYISQNQKSKNANNMFCKCKKLKGSNNITIYNRNNNSAILQNAIILPYYATDISHALYNIDFAYSNIRNIIIGPYVTKMNNIFCYKNYSGRINFYVYEGITTNTILNNKRDSSKENPIGRNLSNLYVPTNQFYWGGVYNASSNIYFYFL